MSIPAWSREYIGLPFREHGRDPEGLDCWGLVRLVLAERFGARVPSYVGEYADTHDAENIGALFREEVVRWVPVPAGQQRCGDVITMRNRGQPIHVGLVLSSCEMLHICKGMNSVVENYLQSIRWRNRVMGFYRHAE